MGKGGGAGGNKGKGKAAGGGAKGKGKGGKEDDGKLKTCSRMKARHILCDKNSKIMEAYKELRDGWLDDGHKVPPAEFGKIAMKYSECSSSKAGGNLGTFPRGKMEGIFQDKAFGLQIGECSHPFKGANGWHIILCENRLA